MEVISFYESERQNDWIDEIGKSDWKAFMEDCQEYM